MYVNILLWEGSKWNVNLGPSVVAAVPAGGLLCWVFVWRHTVVVGLIVVLTLTIMATVYSLKDELHIVWKKTTRSHRELFIISFCVSEYPRPDLLFSNSSDKRRKQTGCEVVCYDLVQEVLLLMPKSTVCSATSLHKHKSIWSIELSLHGPHVATRICLHQSV